MVKKRSESPVSEAPREPIDLMPSEAGRGDADDRLDRISKAAYLRAASRGFNGGDPDDDWLKAEMEIDLPTKRS